jgi:predicted Fe-S protein YdhL (DUF1289 family)
VKLKELASWEKLSDSQQSKYLEQLRKSYDSEEVQRQIEIEKRILEVKEGRSGLVEGHQKKKYLEMQRRRINWD